MDRSTPHLVLAREAALAVPDSFLDFGFFPSLGDRRLFEEGRVPLFLGLRSLRGIEDFDLVLVSNSFGLELLNLVCGFRKSGVPLFASERGEAFPPLILGGSNAFAVQALFRELPGGLDCMADGIFFGEGEGEAGKLVSILAKRGKSKAERLDEAAAAVPGLWVRTASRRARKAVLERPRAETLPLAYPLLNGEEASTARFQISYGCSSFCSFCFEGQDRKPYREVSGPELLEAARELKRNTGASTLELYSFNFNTHTDVFGLLSGLNRLFLQVNFMSQRVDFLVSTPGLLAAETAAGKTSFTLGVEGVSARLRAFYRKGLAEAEIRTATEKLLLAKVREIKYFYILSGHETAEDFAEFRAFLKTLKELRARSHAGTRILFSFGLLVRMPFTPLGYDRLFLREEDWKQAVGETKRDVETHGFEYRLALPWEEYALSQVLALGGFGLHALLAKLAEEGFVYDKELDPRAWLAARTFLGRDLEELSREKGKDWRFPLAAVAEGPETFLYKSWLEAKAALSRPPEVFRTAAADVRASCFEEGEGGCLGCGACADEEAREVLLRHRIKAPQNVRAEAEELGRLVKAKRQAAAVPLLASVPREFAGCSAAWLEAWVLREFFALAPETAGFLLAARRDQPSADLPPRVAWYGRAVFSLLTLEPERLAEALRAAAAGGRGRFSSAEPSSVPDFSGFSFPDLPPSPAAGLEVAIFGASPALVRTLFAKTLEDLHLPGTLARDGGRSGESSGSFEYRLSPKALKKKTLRTARFSELEDPVEGPAFFADLEITEKFDLPELDEVLHKALTTLLPGTEEGISYRFK